MTELFKDVVRYETDSRGRKALARKILSEAIRRKNLASKSPVKK